jgi:hypothetical protein
MAIGRGNDDRWRPGGLRSLAAVAGRTSPLHGADGADARQGIGQQWRSLVATMFDGDLEGCGPSQPWPAVHQHHCTAPTERMPSRDSAGNDHRFLATMIGGDLEGCGPSQPWPAVHQHHCTPPTERMPSKDFAG